MKPRILDLFCGQGGAARGYADAGFEVIGVDIEPQPKYPFEFHQEDAITVLAGFAAGSPWMVPCAAIHASPPCQAFTDMRMMWNAKEHPDLLTPTRELLRRSGVPYIIENVEGAPMQDPVRLCGSSFGLRSSEGMWLRRHRLFECSFAVLAPPCAHGGEPVVGFYGDHARDRRRRDGSERGIDIVGEEAKQRLARELMGIDWMTWRGISQAIPPAYTQFLGERLLSSLDLSSSSSDRGVR